MKLISWNLRGLNSPGKLRMLKNMIKMEKLQICFLQETKCNSSILGNILSKAWPGCQSVAVDASGASGGARHCMEHTSAYSLGFPRFSSSYLGCIPHYRHQYSWKYFECLLPTGSRKQNSSSQHHRSTEYQ